MLIKQTLHIYNVITDSTFLFSTCLLYWATSNTPSVVLKGISGAALKLLLYLVTDDNKQLDVKTDVVQRLVDILDYKIRQRSNDEISLIVEVDERLTVFSVAYSDAHVTWFIFVFDNVCVQRFILSHDNIHKHQSVTVTLL